MINNNNSELAVVKFSLNEEQKALNFIKKCQVKESFHSLKYDYNKKIIIVYLKPGKKNNIVPTKHLKAGELVSKSRWNKIINRHVGY